MNLLAELLSSCVKAARLRFGIRNLPLHLRELERPSGLDVGTVRRELQKRTGPGLVMKTTGPAGLLPTALAGLEVLPAFGVGAVAAGTSRAGSGIDLIVTGAPGLWPWLGAVSTNPGFPDLPCLTYLT